MNKTAIKRSQEKWAGRWPKTYDLLGVRISGTTYDQCVEAIIQAAKAGIPGCVSALAVHGLIEGVQDPIFRRQLNEFHILAPDGQPVRFALNLLYNLRMRDRVYGPELMTRLCKRAAMENVSVYLYGSYPPVVAALAENLLDRFPGLRIVGYEPSVFRPLTKLEDEAFVSRVNEKDPGLVFLGLGCPLQERFAYEHREKINAVQICVGAAFDFLSNTKKMAPEWLQRHGLEWLYRLTQEPHRLWRRYLYTNAIFLRKLILVVAKSNYFLERK